MMRLKTQPNIEPISLEDLKDYMRIDFDDDDEKLIMLMRAAREYCEAYQGQAYLTQEWEMVLGDFSTVRLPLGSTAPSVVYTDSNGVEHDMTTFAYSERTGDLVFYDKPSVQLYYVDPVVVTFTRGADSPDHVSQRTKQAIMLIASHWYETRSPIDDIRNAPQEIGHTLTALLNLDKRYV